MKFLKRVIFILIAFILVVTGIITFWVYKKNAFIWLPDYVFNSPIREETTELTDIIFVVVDHYEPNGRTDILYTWMTAYRELANKHLDFDGVKLQHTWSYPIELFRGYEMDSLVQLCIEGYGEIGIQLHHLNDTSESLRRKFQSGIDSLHAHGALISPDDQVHFSFVHGNWALDNSRLEHGRNYCGVNDEITILLELGCFADVTFPAMHSPAQPALIDKIYYAKDDPLKPKSYNKGIQSRVGVQPESDLLMIIEGPYMIDWQDWRFKTHPTLDDGALSGAVPTSLHRFELWLRSNIHVLGRPNWIFIKSFTHGAGLNEKSYDNILGKNIDEMLTSIERKYNDGIRYRLHYMTVREAYNVIKAAEAGCDGNPNDYRDFIIRPYIYSN